MFLWSANQWTEVDLILPDGKRIHYVRTSSGTSWTDAVFEHTATPTAFYKSTIVWNGHGWDLTLKDGTIYMFGGEAPLQSIRDRFGNTVTLTWSSTNALRIRHREHRPGDVAERALDRVHLRRLESHHPGQGQHRPHRRLPVRRIGPRLEGDRRPRRRHRIHLRHRAPDADDQGSAQHRLSRHRLRRERPGGAADAGRWRRVRVRLHAERQRPDHADRRDQPARDTSGA